MGGTDVLATVDESSRDLRRQAPLDLDGHDLPAGAFELFALPELFALSELACSGFVRIVTNPRIFDPPTPLGIALSFVERLRSRPNCRLVRPGRENWRVFAGLCEEAQASGKVIADACHAALAIEHGCELVSADGDFARFGGLRWSHPLRGGRP